MSPMRHGRSAAVTAAVCAGALFSILASLPNEEPPVITPAAVASSRPRIVEQHPAPHPPETPPVKLANPFDPSETFEFPPGTTDAEARELAASLLLERARQRLASAGEHDRAMQGARPSNLNP